MVEEMKIIKRALEIAKRLPYGPISNPEMRVLFRHGEVKAVRIDAKTKALPSAVELRDLVKHLRMTLTKGLTPFEFPMLEGNEGKIKVRIYCKSCPPGYEAVVSVGSRGKVIRRCQKVME